MGRRRRTELPFDLPRVFRGREAVDAGLLSRKELRGPLVRRLFHGVYAPAWIPATHELRCEAAGLVMPEAAALTGRSGMAALGVDLTDWQEPVAVVVPEWARFGPVRGLSVRLSTYPVAGRTWRTTQVAFPARLAFDVAARSTIPNAVAGLDAGLRAGLFERDAVEKWLETCYDHGVVGVRTALSLTDARAESPPESIVRCVLALDGISTQPQYAIQLPGGLLHVDLAVPERRLAIEYNGNWHRRGSRPAKDRRRYAALRRLGWHVVVIDADLLGDHAAVVAVVRAELEGRPLFPVSAA